MIQDIIKKAVEIVASACASITQELIVGFIGVGVLVIIGYKIYQFFFHAKEQKGPCGCSSCGCSSSEKEKNSKSKFAFEKRNK